MAQVKKPLLKEYNPNLLKDWDYDFNQGRNPNKISIGSSKFLVSWKCHKCGYKWEQKVCNRVNHNSQCLKCRNEETLISNKYPHLIEEWDWDNNENIDPYLLTIGSDINANWKCKICDHKWKQPVYVRIKLNNSCKNCQNKNSFFVNTHPHLLEEWDWENNANIDPKILSKGSNKKVSWICKKCKNKFQAEVYRRTKNNSGCGKCRVRKKTTKKFIDKYPELLKEWDFERNENIDINKFTYGSNVKVWWKCPSNHSYESMIVDRTLNSSGCPYCRGLKVDSTNSLAVLKPDLLEQWDYEKNIEIDPKKIPVGTNQKVWWKCEQGHSWFASVVNRSKAKSTKCPYCVGRTATNENSFGNNFSDLMIEWDWNKNVDINPYSLRTKSNKKVWWKCKKEHSWQSSLNTRTSQKTGCPYCYGRFTNQEDSFATRQPQLLEEWFWEKNKEIDPYTTAERSDKKVWWICKNDKNHFWKTNIYHRINGTGCPYCASTNIILNRYLANRQMNLFSEIILYRLIVFNDKECFYKIGITKNSIEERYRTLYNRTKYKLVVVNFKKGTIKSIIDEEQTIHKKTTRKLDDALIKYRPAKYFDGVSECYNTPNEYGSLRLTLINSYQTYKSIEYLNSLKID
ncbi:MAG: zinc-ribbon domain-containing protein [Bacteroidetes bacterium]|nr:zinc-ribbon domain-containing protein [Bacteroidota bacterium]